MTSPISATSAWSEILTECAGPGLAMLSEAFRWETFGQEPFQFTHRAFAVVGGVAEDLHRMTVDDVGAVAFPDLGAKPEYQCVRREWVGHEYDSLFEQDGCEGQSRRTTRG